MVCKENRDDLVMLFVYLVILGLLVWWVLNKWAILGDFDLFDLLLTLIFLLPEIGLIIDKLNSHKSCE